MHTSPSIVALLGLLATLSTACGATADPLPPADGGTPDARPFGPHGCRFGEARISGQCVPFDDDNCGAIGRACAAEQNCAVSGDGMTLTVSCVAN